MQADKVLEIVLREMQAYSHGWRADWSDFDGRTLRSQMQALAEWAEGALAQPEDGDYTRGSEFRAKLEAGE